jgi:hypothetical protein
MDTAKMLVFAGFSTLLLSSAALGQTVISARSGLVHYVEGEAWLDNDVIEPKAGEFPEVKEKSVFRTGEGRAEILLNSGVFLRLAENSSIRMISNRLIDTRIELASGNAMVEAAEILPDNAVTIVAGEAMTSIVKKGLYAFDGSPSRLRVYDGEAGVEVAGQTLQVKEGRMIALDGKNLTAEKFDNKAGDELYRWSRHRAEYVAMANASAAHSLQQSGSMWQTSGWQYNPWFGMFTFIPANGILYSPFGYGFYSPSAVWYAYYPQNYYGGGGGYFGGGGSSFGYDSRGGYVTAARGTGSVVSSGNSAVSSAPSSPAVSAGGGSRGGGGADRGSSAGGGRGH